MATCIPEGRHAVMVLNRAAWHTTKRLKKFANISLLFLPPASPELNPKEQVWQVLRDQSLANRSFDGYDEIVDACCEAWNNFVDIPLHASKLYVAGNRLIHEIIIRVWHKLQPTITSCDQQPKVMSVMEKV